MRRTVTALLVMALLLVLVACGSNKDVQPQKGQDNQQSAASEDSSITEEQEQQSKQEETPVQEPQSADEFYIKVGESWFTATFADNPGANALRDMLSDGPITLQLRDYGGFEKVGPLGQSLPTQNAQTTTKAGDIVLYQGNQVVLFYGSNSWSYTRLGSVSDLTGWSNALGQGDVTVIFSLTK